MEAGTDVLPLPQQPPPAASRPRRRCVARGMRGMRAAAWAGLQFLVLAWGLLAIYYSNLPWAWGRSLLALAFVTFGIWAMWVTRRPRMGWAFAGGVAAVAIWFASIRPSHERPWRPEAAVLPRAMIRGDTVRIENFRTFDYRSIDDVTPRYETRAFTLSRVSGVDLFISYWQPGPVGHTFLSFTFDDGTPPLCVSIEARPELGETFAALPSMFKRFELMYVVGDERDLVRVRTDHRNEDVYLYRLRASPDGAQRLLRVYLERINELAGRPQFYHLLSNNCTINIVRYAKAAGGEAGFDVRHLLNGYVDVYLYASGRLDTTMALEELRARSRITDAARDAGTADDFSTRIRAGLPRPVP